MPEPSARSISDEAQRLGLSLTADSCQRLAVYAASLWSWNERLNLTRHTDVARFVSRDVADAMAIAPHLGRGEHVLDVGTGGGVPGALLAIIRPDLRVELCDSVAKKARAVASIVREAGLSVRTHEAAGQSVVKAAAARKSRFDTLVVRAVAPLAKLLAWFEPLAGEYGRMLVVKGPRWEDEKEEARRTGFGTTVTIRRIAGWPIRGSDNESVLLEIRPR